MGFTNVGNWGVALSTDVELNATAETIGSGATTLYALEIDNSDNEDDVYVKLYNASPTVGTTAPYVIIRVSGGEVFPYIPSGLGEGIAFSALYAVAVTAAGTAGTGTPTNAVRATFLTD